MKLIPAAAMAMLLFAPVSLVYGQLDSNSVTVTSTRTLSSAPDQLVYRVNALGPLTSTLDEAVAQVRSLGLTGADFVNVSVSTVATDKFEAPERTVLCWTFNLIFPLSKVKATLDALSAAMASIPKNNPAWSLSFSYYSTQSSALPTVCPLEDLVAEAKTRAQKLVSAAGLGLGQVLSISGSTPFDPYCSLTVKFGLTRF